jgi:macrodomain Ter protein organizer (MatP/YcbG family)
MTNQHPITPPPELVDKWYDEWLNADELIHLDQAIAAKAARWGADQELEACCGFIGCEHSVAWSSKLRAARRPKPPSLKEQALEALKVLERDYVIGVTTNTIRKALEALPE